MPLQLICNETLHYMETSYSNDAFYFDWVCAVESTTCDPEIPGSGCWQTVPFEAVEVSSGGGGGTTIFESLTIAEAETLVGYALLVWFTAWAARKIIDMIIERPHGR